MAMVMEWENEILAQLNGKQSFGNGIANNGNDTESD